MPLANMFLSVTVAVHHSSLLCHSKKKQTIVLFTTLFASPKMNLNYRYDRKFFSGKRSKIILGWYSGRITVSKR